MNELTAALKEELNVDTAFTLPILAASTSRNPSR